VLQPLQERRDAGLAYRIVLGQRRKYTDAHPVALLARALRAATSPPPRRRAA